MAFTDIQICSAALTKIGANPITSFTDNGTEAKVASQLYETTVQDILSCHPWRFATNYTQLSRLVDVPDGRYGAAYQVPTNSPDVLSVNSVWVNRRPIDFDRFEDNIHCDASEADTVLMEAVYRVDEQFWPAYFVKQMQYELASLFAESVAQKTDLADYFGKKAEQHMMKAKHRDSQGRSAVKIETSRLVQRRFSRNAVGDHVGNY